MFFVSKLTLVKKKRHYNVKIRTILVYTGNIFFRNILRTEIGYQIAGVRKALLFYVLYFNRWTSLICIISNYLWVSVATQNNGTPTAIQDIDPSSPHSPILLFINTIAPHPQLARAPHQSALSHSTNCAPKSRAPQKHGGRSRRCAPTH